MKESFIFEGKKYISSRRASEISDYASDYIGQLCRANKLDCRMIGRSWFVTEESLHLHKASISREDAARNRIDNLRGGDKSIGVPNFAGASVAHIPLANNRPALPASILLTEKIYPTAKVSDLAQIQTLPIGDIEANNSRSSFKYSKDERPLLPVLNSKIETKSVGAVKKDVEDPKKNIGEQRSDDLSKSVISILNRSLEKSGALKKIVSTEDIRKKVPVKGILTYQKLARDIILRRALAPALVLVLFFAVGTGTYVATEKVGQSISTEITRSAQTVTANISDAFNSAYAMLKDGYSSMIAFFTSPARLALDTATPKEFLDVTVSEVTPNGIVLTQSGGSDLADEVMKQKIQGSFSDEVIVSPDKSGTTGVITPVFKDTDGKDFIYVMVPVKDKSNRVIEE